MRRSLVTTLAAGLAAAIALAAPAFAAGKYKKPNEYEWSFDGPFGTFDRAQLQRGYLVYKQVCAQCHGLKQLAYRNLSDPGGPEFTPAEVKALLAKDAMDPSKPITVPDIDEQGNPIERPATPADRFKYPFANENVGKSTYGVYPPDLSVIAKGRHDGPNYIVSLLTGYYDPNVVLGVYKCSKLAADKSCAEYSRAADGETGVDGLPSAQCITEVYPEGPDDTDLPATVKTCTAFTGGNYNPYFPGGNVAMPDMLTGGVMQLEFADGTKPELKQAAQDVSAFLMWAAEPKLEERKRLGIGVLLFLAVLSLLSYMAYRHMWRDVGH